MIELNLAARRALTEDNIELIAKVAPAYEVKKSAICEVNLNTIAHSGAAVDGRRDAREDFSTGKPTLAVDVVALTFCYLLVFAREQHQCLCGRMMTRSIAGRVMSRWIGGRVTSRSIGGLMITGLSMAHPIQRARDFGRRLDAGQPPL